MLGRGLIHPALILDEQRGATLVDTGTPGQVEAVLAMLAQLGLTPGDLRRIILTHHDLDHIGSLAELVARSGAEVLTSEAEVPYIQDGARPQKLPPADQVDAMIAGNPGLPQEIQAFLRAPPQSAVPVTRVLHDGEVLDVAGGVRVVFTPGHTVGHLSLYVLQDDVLITGDALSSEAGQLSGPSAQATADMIQAMQSVQKLAQLNPSAMLTYHGGVVEQDPALQLTRVAGRMEADLRTRE